ncbi:PPC domain-containing DNA-binding protein [Desulfofustis glycolicus]|uniref:Predicted DNA-binding protein with PD1-like DNA-binding motif n=1 Tax=Desulfofustis glycolicus DSM 9705 TaxID=1121409 RepID=A0A1M5WR66_9BACT|nr:PPC domain-containing DNA-binding protein [Desulfofustis glycolicus]MCB2218333.1 DNA-binding protein [Desulfobulbaceae bacterium]SHH89998.1 Predicted DNA-binding protein with PD1-like DNA-binding motif [Desulfofustis glycolicus DSM 9705]
MRFSEARQGRVFILRLEDGDIVHQEIERFAKEQAIAAAALIIVGGADRGSRLVVGPETDRGLPLRPMQTILEHAHEITGTGTLFRDEDGQPLLHMHLACGRGEKTVTGCIRSGVAVWHVMEVILFEICDTTAKRADEAPLDLKLLQP